MMILNDVTKHFDNDQFWIKTDKSLNYVGISNYYLSINSNLVSPSYPNPHSSLKWIGELARHLVTFQGFQVSGYGVARDTNRLWFRDLLDFAFRVKSLYFRSQSPVEQPDYTEV
jgi:hypothetical protein